MFDPYNVLISTAAVVAGILTWKTGKIMARLPAAVYRYATRPYRPRDPELFAQIAAILDESTAWYHITNGTFGYNPRGTEIVLTASGEMYYCRVFHDANLIYPSGMHARDKYHLMRLGAIKHKRLLRLLGRRRLTKALPQKPST